MKRTTPQRQQPPPRPDPPNTVFDGIFVVLTLIAISIAIWWRIR